jgi:hypothetical protein
MCTTGDVDTSVKWKKSSIRKVLYFVWTLLGSRVSILMNFFLQVHFRCKQSDIVPFAAGVIDTGRKFATVLLITVV